MPRGGTNLLTMLEDHLKADGGTWGMHGHVGLRTRDFGKGASIGSV